MAKTSTRLMRLIALLLFLSITAVYAQADLPDLATVTNTNEATSAASTGEPTTAASTAESSAETTGDAATTDSTASGGTAAQTTATFPDATSTSSGTTFRLTDLPTIAGAGVPTIVVPYTANAPFMQKSSMPEGTVFIAVGAVLAFLGACVLLWRGLVAWSVNRSVKRAALASIRGTEKPGAWGGGHYNSKSAYYKEFEGGSSMSLDHLTSSGKAQKPGKNEEGHRHSSAAPPAGLFFSPTAQASNRASTYSVDNRGSTYLPAGYYALPSGDAPAGGRNSAVLGSSHLAPYARNSYMGGNSPSPPGSPNPTVPGSRPASNFYGGPGDSRAGLRSGSRDGPRSASRGPPSRDGYGGRGSHLYTQPSSSSLAVGQSTSDLPGQRAPSAIFDDMLDVHGNGPRERF
ncbi:hypothetical protein SMMN14_07709 [Sphaerulina musiva]